MTSGPAADRGPGSNGASSVDAQPAGHRTPWLNARIAARLNATMAEGLQARRGSTPSLDALRIGLVCPYSLSVPGGVQMQVLGLARELRRRGHPAVVLGPCDGPPPASFVRPLGNSLPTAANGSIAPLAPDVPAALRTMRALHDERFDVVHLHEPFSPGPTVTALMAQRSPTIGTFHAAGRSSGYRALTRPLTRMARRLALRVAVSKDAAALAQRYLAGEYEVLFNGVDVETIRSAEPWTGSTNGDPVVFFCGRHEERKGLRQLIDAVGVIAGQGRPLRVWIAGVGPDTEALQQRTAADPQLRRRVEWLGRITDSEKYARLRRADVFCAPSLGGESFGVVLIEAMAAETTVVASSLDGYQNVATDRVDALLAPPGDVDVLAAALLEAVSSPELTRQLRERGAARAGEFAMSRLADLYIERYARVLGVTAS